VAAVLGRGYTTVYRDLWVAGGIGPLLTRFESGHWHGALEGDVPYQ